MIIHIMTQSAIALLLTLTELIITVQMPVPQPTYQAIPVIGALTAAEAPVPMPIQIPASRIPIILPEASVTTTAR